MKTNAPFLRRLAVAALVLAAATQPSFAQTATTTPVGFVTMIIAGGGTQSAPAYTFTSLGIVNPIAWQSMVTGISTTTNPNDTITDSSATWTAGAYNQVTVGANTYPAYFLEILSGAGAGTIYDIVQNTANTVTLAGSLNSLVTTDFNNAVTISYAIRPHWTIASVFGATNQNGLQGGTSSNAADNIQLFRNGGYLTYYYSTGGFGGTGWRRFDTGSADQSNAVIYPDDGIVIGRRQSAQVNLVLSGAVKTGQTSIPVAAGYSLLGNVYSASMTLANSGLYTGDPTTGLAPGNGSSTGDQVLFWNGTGFVTYYYSSGGFAGTGWRGFTTGSTDESTTPIPVGTCVFIKRAGAAAFNWVVPQTPSSFN